MSERVYESILQGLKEAVDYEKGELEARTSKCEVNTKAELSKLETFKIHIDILK